MIERQKGSVVPQFEKMFRLEIDVPEQIEQLGQRRKKNIHDDSLKEYKLRILSVIFQKKMLLSLIRSYIAFV